MTDFVHLNVHTDFSLKDSTIRVKDLIEETSAKGMKSVAMTDLSNMFGGVRLYSHGHAKQVKPIIGSELTLESENHGRSGAITLICKDTAGYKNMMEIISAAYLNGRESDDHLPTVSSDLIDYHSEGILALSGAHSGLIGQLLLEGSYDAAKDLALHYKSLFKDDFYIELQRIGHPYEDDYIEAAVELASELSIPVVATNSVRFLTPDDHASHEVRRAICRKTTIGQLEQDSNTDKSILCTPHQYLKTPQEMIDLFKDIPVAISNTVQVAKKCSVDIELGKNYLPVFPVPEGMTEDDFLEEESRNGLQARLDFLYGKDNPNIESIRKPYDERLDYELGIIRNMGFPGYFLIVADFIQWSKDNDIAVGPGRGSGAGSLVAYALKITDLDPLHYELLFERFLNPERVSMPDFDIDFCMENRDKVIDYVARKYGRRAVSQIITYGTMAARSVLRDVARALGKPYAVGDRIARMIPDVPGIKFKDVMESQLEFITAYESDMESREVITHALALEGLTRQTGKHAGGVLIAPSKLTEFTPTYVEADGSSGFVSQYDKDDVEKAGLVKFDFLGLRTLTIIQNALFAINDKRKKSGEEPIDILGIPLDDPASYELIKSEKTTAVFQLESRGMKSLIHRLQPDNIEEIIALVALFRPGPLEAGMVDDFVNRKHGRSEVTYLHPDLEQILNNTYGVFVYQEQVMQTAQILAGYTLGQADMLRRAMGKKKPEEMQKQREIFTKGCVENNIPESKATQIFDLMEKFAGYGFNKSHSAAYGLIAYQTAWLKAHYPAEFMASVLSSDMSNTDKVVLFVNECKDMGLKILPPDINASKREFVAKDSSSIIYGMEAVKGMGTSAVKVILEERYKNGVYKGLFDLCARISPHKRVMEASIRAGVFDSFGASRAALMTNWQKARETGKQIRSKEDDMTSDLFGDIEREDDILQSGRVREWTIQEVLQGERKTLGLFLSGHPVDEYPEEIQRISTGKLVKYITSEVDSAEDILGGDDHRVVIVGVPTEIDVRVNRKGHTAIMTIDDGSAQVQCIATNKVYAESQPFLLVDNPLVIEGTIRKDRRTGIEKLIAYKISSLEFARNKILKGLRIKNFMNFDDNQKKNIVKLLESSEYGSTPVVLEVERDGKITDIPVNSHNILASDGILRNIRTHFGDSAYEMIFDDVVEVEDNDQFDIKAALAIEGNKTREERHKSIAKLLRLARESMG